MATSSSSPSSSPYMPNFNFRIDLGHIITIITMLIVLSLAWGEMGAKIDASNKQLIDVRIELNALHDKVDTIREAQIKTQVELEDRLYRDKDKGGARQ